MEDEKLHGPGTKRNPGNIEKVQSKQKKVIKV